MTSGEDRLVAILDGIGECFYALDRDWRITVFNRGAEMFFGRSREEMLGQPVVEMLRVDDTPGVRTHYEEAMAGIASPVFQLASRLRPGRILEIRTYPLPDGIGVTFRDATDRLADEAALRLREAELARVQRIAGIGGLEVEFGSGFRNRRSPEYLMLHGLPPEAAEEPNEEWLARIHPQDREATERTVKQTLKGRSLHYAAEYRIVRPSDGETRWISATAEIERGPDGRAIRMIGAHHDITERKRAEVHQRLLINELNHRVKNTLATVQSLAFQSLRGAEDPKAAWTAFEGRLMALSRVHDVLTRESWEGADLADVANDALQPFRGAGSQDRITLQGRSIRLSPRAALAFAMMFQELATNALKHGALSCETGRIAVVWSQGAGHALELTWRESGGPPVAPPLRRGFGTRLLQAGLSEDLDATVELAFEPSGVVASLRGRDSAAEPAALTYEV